MIRLIGGPARCGKSTLFQVATTRFTCQAISLDNFRKALFAVTSGDTLETLQLSPKESEYTPREWVEKLRIKDKPLWVAARGYIEAAAKNSDDVLLEGCIWPDFLIDITTDYRAVFLVDTGPDHKQRVMSAARNEATHNNWMKDWTDERLATWADYNIARSERIKQLANAHDLPVFDIADYGIQAAQDAALEALTM